MFMIAACKSFSKYYCVVSIIHFSQHFHKKIVFKLGQKNLWIWPDSKIYNFRNQERKEVELFFWNGLRLLSRICELEIFGSQCRVGSLPVS